MSYKERSILIEDISNLFLIRKLGDKPNGVIFFGSRFKKEVFPFVYFNLIKCPSKSFLDIDPLT